MTLFKCESPIISSKGSGYYNYYNISDRYKTEKPREIWYKRDLSAQEIGSNNAGVKNKDSEGADLYRKLETIYESAAVSNRLRYDTVDELQKCDISKIQFI